MSDIGDYYRRCEERRREAADRLTAAKCPKCFGWGR